MQGLPRKGESLLKQQKKREKRITERHFFMWSTC